MNQLTLMLGDRIQYLRGISLLSEQAKQIWMSCRKLTELELDLKVLAREI